MVRIAEYADCKKIFQLQRNAFETEWWNESEILKDLSDQQKLYLVYEENKKVVGFVSFLISIGQADILQIVVDKDYQRKGIATTLLLEGVRQLKEKQIKEVLLEVRASNEAIKFYERLGFVPIHTRKQYYGNEDGVVFIKQI